MGYLRWWAKLFHAKEPEKEKLVLKTSILVLGKSCLFPSTWRRSDGIMRSFRSFRERREREREREREKREREREMREREGERERESRDRDRDRDRETERQTETETRDRGQRDRDRQRQTDRQRCNTFLQQWDIIIIYHKMSSASLQHPLLPTLPKSKTA